MVPDGVTLREICCSPRMVCRLWWYPPGYRQDWHAHPEAQVSLLLAGGLREDAPGEETTVSSFSVAARPQGAEHAVAFGRSGALILSFDLLTTPEYEEAVPAESVWRWRAAHRAKPLVTDLARRLSGPAHVPAEEVEDLLWDVLSLRDGETRLERVGEPPSWLSHLQQYLDDEPGRVSVAAVARAAGVHRTHLARMFRRHYGVPVSSYRRRAQVSLAVRHLTDGAAPVVAACEAGFADQIHLPRTIRAETGFTPGVLRRLALAAVRTH